MKFSREDSDVVVRGGGPLEPALARVTHLCIGAHQDDIEIMAPDGIAECYDSPDRAFAGVVVTNGAGSSRTGRYEQVSDDAMIAVRRGEQRRAAELGRYAVQIQLGHPSADVKQPAHAGVRADLNAIFEATQPQVVYLHNPADKHDTHVAVFLRCLAALRALPVSRRPARVLGCEVWRGLDWLDDAAKVAIDAGKRPELMAQLLEVFQSQIAGGKRYDLAALGRRAANATFHTAHATDALQSVVWAIDLAPLVHDDKLSVSDFISAHLDRLRSDVLDRLRRFQG